MNGMFALLVSSFGEWWYWLVALFGYLLHWRINHALNGGGGTYGDLCKDYLTDALFAVPGGRRRRGEFIRTIIGEDVSVRGSMEGHSYEDIRANDLYEEVGAKMLPGPIHFWGQLLGWAIWPVSIVLVIIFGIVSWVLHGVLALFLGEKGTHDFYEKLFRFFEEQFPKKKAQ